MTGMKLATAVMLAQASAFLAAPQPDGDLDQAWRDFGRQHRKAEREAMKQANPKAPSVRAKKRAARHSMRRTA